MREKKTKKRLLPVLIIAGVLAAALLIWRLVPHSFQRLLPTEEETSLPDEERYSGMLLSKGEYPELYEQAAALLETDQLSQIGAAKG
ncbi:MAG: hypothetical protein LUH58_02935 [Lachnospiraceae bacterium]|nr:hypothetical protein [Lachnospiraceae bacterium]